MSHHPVAPVCQADTSASAPTTSTTSTAAPTTTIMTCPSGWTEFQGGCYKFFSSSSETWVIADSLCLAEGARLTSVHSMEEENFLNSLSNGNSYWIGVGYGLISQVLTINMAMITVMISVCISTTVTLEVVGVVILVLQLIMNTTVFVS